MKVMMGGDDDVDVFLGFLSKLLIWCGLQISRFGCVRLRG